MKLLDLFCGAGGASAGYAAAGFEVFGVDIVAQPHYPFQFFKADALAFPVAYGFDAIHASPPCQAHSDLQHQSRIEYPDLIAPIRERLVRSGLPYIIENVVGAPLIDPVLLCGADDALFPDLRVIRHRLFESNVPLVGSTCPLPHPKVFTYDKRKKQYGKLNQNKSYVQVTGGGNCRAKNKRNAMGTSWMTGAECNEAVPPAYTEFIGHQLMEYLQCKSN